MAKKVVLGCPTYDGKGYCLDKYAAGIKALTYKDLDVLIVDNSRSPEYSKRIRAAGLPVKRVPWQDNVKERMIAARNLIRDEVLKKGYEWFFCLEQDVVPEPDVIETLMKHGKKVVSGVVVGALDVYGYLKKVPMIWVDSKVHKDGLWFMDREEILKPQLAEIKACSLSCVLIHRDVLEKVKFRYYPKTFDDMPFSEDAIKAGYKLYVDTTVQPRHYSRAWQ